MALQQTLPDPQVYPETVCKPLAELQTAVAVQLYGQFGVGAGLQVSYVPELT